MKGILWTYSLAVTLSLILMARPSLGAERMNGVNLGGSFVVGPDTTATLLFAEYERLLSNRFSILGRIGTLDYKYDDDSYEEDGDGPGVEFGVRFYPAGNGMNGFYLGGGMGIWSTDWDWIEDKGQSYETRGSGKSTAWDLNANVGAKFPLGNSGFHIEPNALIGNWFSVDDSCNYADGSACDRESELGFYGLIALNIGMTF